MDFINTVLKVFVGDKSQKDVKALQPVINQIHSFEKELEGMDNDALRSKTFAFKAKIKEDGKAIFDQIEVLKNEAKASADIDRNEDIYAEIDKLQEEAYKGMEKSLDEILPEAFAVVKETAKRFVHNETLTVTASEFDRKISGIRDYVSLDADKAIWNNSWDAAGKEVTWDMIHYDVQLIGGIAMHQGKIAEMHATLPQCLDRQWGTFSDG